MANCDSLKREILTVWKGNFWQFEKEIFDSLEREILTVWKGNFWQFGKGNFDSLKKEILTVWRGNFWQFEKGIFDSLEREILTVWKRKFWQFEKEIFDSLEREILTVWKRKFWQFKYTQFGDHYHKVRTIPNSVKLFPQLKIILLWPREFQPIFSSKKYWIFCFIDLAKNYFHVWIAGSRKSAVLGVSIFQVYTKDHGKNQGNSRHPEYILNNSCIKNSFLLNRVVILLH